MTEHKSCQVRKERQPFFPRHLLFWHRGMLRCSWGIFYSTFASIYPVIFFFTKSIFKQIPPLGACQNRLYKYFIYFYQSNLTCSKLLKHSHQLLQSMLTWGHSPSWIKYFERFLVTIQTSKWASEGKCTLTTFASESKKRKTTLFGPDEHNGLDGHPKVFPSILKHLEPIYKYKLYHMNVSVDWPKWKQTLWTVKEAINFGQTPFCKKLHPNIRPFCHKYDLFGTNMVFLTQIWQNVEHKYGIVVHSITF